MGFVTFASKLKKYEELCAEGMKTEDAAKKVGVHYLTICNWRNNLVKKSVQNVAADYKVSIIGPNVWIEQNVSRDVMSEIVTLILRSLESIEPSLELSWVEYKKAQEEITPMLHKSAMFSTWS